MATVLLEVPEIPSPWVLLNTISACPEGHTQDQSSPQAAPKRPPPWPTPCILFVEHWNIFRSRSYISYHTDGLAACRPVRAFR